MCAAARVTLPWRSSASNTGSRFKSGVVFIGLNPAIYAVDWKNQRHRFD
jgi:hypothetical protein